MLIIFIENLSNFVEIFILSLPKKLIKRFILFLKKSTIKLKNWLTNKNFNKNFNKKFPKKFPKDKVFINRFNVHWDVTLKNFETIEASKTDHKQWTFLDMGHLYYDVTKYPNPFPPLKPLNK